MIPFSLKIIWILGKSSVFQKLIARPIKQLFAALPILNTVIKELESHQAGIFWEKLVC